MVVLPFCHLRLEGRRPRPKGYPEAPETVGQYLKRRRLDLGMLQKEAAKVLGTNPLVYGSWERGQVVPGANQMARIVRFLGTAPLVKSASLPGRLREFRRQAGLTQAQLAARVRATQATVSDWELGVHVPPPRFWPRIISALGVDPAPTPTTMAERLVAARRRLGITQVQLAAMLRVRAATVWAWEAGRCEPGARVLLALKSLFERAGIPV